MYEEILIPTDGSAEAGRAASHGLYLASLFDASVHVLAVVDIASAAGPFDAGGIDEEFRRRLEADAEESIEAVTSLAASVDDLTTAVEKGDPATEILSYTERNEIDLIAMGNQGRTGVHRYIAGSTTEQVARLSPVPVLTSRDTDRSRAVTEFDDILLPTDGSEPAEQAIDHAIAIAQQAQAHLHVVSVVNVGDLVAGPTYTLPSDVLDHVESKAIEATETVVGRANDAGVDSTTTIPTGRPSRELLTYIDANDIDLVAMGTHGHSGLERVLLGSTTERIMRHATIPVLSVSARD